jgi:energy-coupling factor transporter ATP-binding protein EcfA2
MRSRLVEFKIDGLFGLYSHRIALNLKERITIIIGPNGRGKTVCLKFIEALFKKNYSYFMDIPFKYAQFTFTGGEIIKVDSIEEQETDPRTGRTRSKRSVQIVFQPTNGEPITWLPSPMDSRVRAELRRHIPASWHEVSPGIWEDRTDGEQLEVSDMIERFRLPSRLASIVQQPFPESLAAFLNNIACHLIETQRLLVLSEFSDEDEVYYHTGPRRRARESRIAIEQKAQKLISILRDTLTRYASLSQSLDRTFPLRVFEAQESSDQSQDELREALRELDGRREALMSAGILDTEYQPVTLRGGEIDRGVAMALELYVKDAVKKLDVFNDLLGRVNLFKELIENRFIDKTLQIDRERGFKITSKTFTEVPLDKLSSGEQHQLILVFDLLFEVTPDSLILIDEPELSLHVAWQKAFIESLTRIIELNGFDVVLATHSPGVAARHFDLTVELGPVE